eukprot:gb/GECG01009640.1/.p1 GENE.gb/GECG01009640.1/~~gb/GECG01009640.1/.p1  ORF type:complete len:142 (+),score=22.49 gb/GECG01009640.1/:1-426(+)
MASEQGSAALNKSAVATPRAPTAIGPYTQAIRGNGQLFVSGMIGLDSDSGKLVSDDVQEQAREALNNLKAVVEAGGTTLEAIVKVTVMMTDIEDYKKINDVYKEFFPSEGKVPAPARCAFGVSGLPKGAKVEFDCIALTSD